MIGSGKLVNVAGEIRSSVAKEEIREKLGLLNLKEMVFERWITWEDIDWSLKSNHDGNLPHKNPEIARVFVERVLPEAISALSLKKPFLIAPGLLLLTHCEKIGIDIGLEHFGDPLLPTQLHVIWQVPLIVTKDEPQLVEFEFKPSGRNQFLVEVRYGNDRFRKFFKEPVMVCHSRRNQISPFVFCKASNRKSGIDTPIQKKFERVIEGKCSARRVSQGKFERDSYFRSVGCSLEIPEKIYRENVPSTHIGALIPSDIPVALDEKKICQGNEIFLWNTQLLHFDQTQHLKFGRKLTMKVLLWRESERTANVFGIKRKVKLRFIDVAFLRRKFLGRDKKVYCLGRSVITSL